MEKLYGTDLLRALCDEFGPTGDEWRVAELIKEQLKGTADGFYCDRMGNISVKFAGGGEGYDEKAPAKVMISAHMDEVGMIVNEITDDGFLKFKTLGGIDQRVLCGRCVRLDNGRELINGVIASKAIHLQSPEERKAVTTADKMYIDIGASGREMAAENIAVGDSATFDTDFILFGSGNKMMKGKAIDDRLGCAVMIETLRRLKDENKKLPYDVYFCFTVREEIGISGAQTTAQRIMPDVSIVLESTAIADIADVAPNSRVANVGAGGAISLADRSTIYDRKLVDLAMSLSAEKKIPAQIKRYVSGGNDAGHIHKSGKGVRALAISAPTRYLHSASCVASVEDFEAIRALVYELLTSGKLA